MTAFSQTLKITWTGPGSTSLAGSVTRTADSEGGASVDLTALEADKLVTLAIRVAGLKLLYMKCTTGCTVKTNSSSAADDELTLTAGVPVHYLDAAGMTNPLTTDVTSLYLTETGDATGTFEIRWLVDGTP